MTKKDWQKIEAAKELLGLEDKATLAEIKGAYRGMSKIYHPDLAGEEQARKGQVKMHEIAEAYRILVYYCVNYRFPLIMQNESLDAEDWWLDRFGQDPLWGKSQDDD